jgi:hypothetical protein
MRILLDEEYGYRYWLWDTQDKEITSDFVGWFNRIIKDVTCLFDCHTLPGAVIDVGDETFQSAVMAKEFDYYIHLHEPEDSYIRAHNEIGG